MSWRRYDDFRYFPPSHPLAAKGGIKPQSKKGAFGESWWAGRWIAILESFQMGARLGRGRSYARRGQVLSITIDKGLAKASVQGSRPKPYDITIKIKTLSAAQWKKLAKIVSHQAIFAAKLLAGEMPKDIEKVFRDAHLSLFPEKLKELDTDCSCPDWANPCKHIAAVYYILGEEFDRDPFLIFKLRGMNRKEMVALLGDGSVKKGPRGTRGKSPTHETVEEVPLPPEPLPMDISSFWSGSSLADYSFGEVRVPPVPAALPKRLGSFPFWQGEQRFLEAIEPIYAQASPHGVDMFLAEPLNRSASANPNPKEL
jgi:uncharacterized Zn finger protein